jgi:hypothetical protein
MGHNDSKGGGGHGSPGMAGTGQLGRGGSQAPAKVDGLEVRRAGTFARGCLAIGRDPSWGCPQP